MRKKSHVEFPLYREYSITGTSGWPLTRPAPVVRGYIVSDTYHRFALSAAGDDANDVYPPELQGEELPQSSVFEALRHFASVHEGLPQGNGS